MKNSLRELKIYNYLFNFTRIGNFTWKMSSFLKSVIFLLFTHFFFDRLWFFPGSDF